MSTSHFSNGISGFLAASKRPLIVVLGPTASGKTAFSIDLALERGNVEIINADSRQLYAHLDIGTAKITKKEMRCVPHHLLDVADPNDEITAADYQRMAEDKITEIRSRGKIPMMVGGSMLYISSIIDGLRFPDAPDPRLRKKLEHDYDADGGKALYETLKSIDPETAESFSPANKPYVIRAMEIYQATGEKPSVVRKRGASAHDLFIIGIDRDPKELNARIEARTNAMIESGWIEEVQKLLLMGYGPNAPGMKSHGYREIIAFLQGNESDTAYLEKTIATKTKHYAKRQRTWWRGDERITWIHL